MKFRNIPYYITLGLLTVGAALIVGLLSFGGMFALWPILTLAFTVFALSVMFEVEIYLRNIIGALDKLFKRNYLKQQLTDDFLDTHELAIGADDCPQFFKDYRRQGHLCNQFEHKRLDNESRLFKEKLDETRRVMKEYFATHLFSRTELPTAYDLALKLIPKGKKLHSLAQLPGAFDPTYQKSYIFIESTNKVYFVTAQNKFRPVPETEAFKQRLATLMYDKHLRDWLAGCDIHTTDALPADPLLDADKPYKNAYVFIETNDSLVYFNSKGELEPVHIDPHHLAEFKQNLQTIMNNSKFKRLTRAQIKTLTTSINTTKQTPLAAIIDDQTRQQQKYATRRTAHRFFLVGSILAGLFMGLGTTYLLVETFTVIPFLAALPFTIWPMLIVPMAIIAGTAYGLLTYNAITDMLANDTIRAWYKKLSHDLSQGITVRNVLMASAAIALFTLTLALTICTAGTWWTIAKHTRPLFVWMSKMPAFIMQVLNPMIIGISSLFFNLENTAETLTLIDEATQPVGWCDLLSLSVSPNSLTLDQLPMVSDAAYVRVRNDRDNKLFYVNKVTKACVELMIKPKRLKRFDKQFESVYADMLATNKVKTLSAMQLAQIKSITHHTPDSFIFAKIAHSIQASIDHLRAKENTWQIFNPGRLLLKLTITPLRVILFLGHLISIGVMTDRLPGIPEILSALLGIISEGFEDAHYFVGAGHQGHGHNHDLDIPTQALQFIFYPLYCLAALWDWQASLANEENSGRRRLTFHSALEKQWGLKPEETVTLAEDAPSPSLDWQKKHVDHLISCRREELAATHVGIAEAEVKREALKQLQNDVLELDFKQPEALKLRLATEVTSQMHLYRKQRATPTFFKENTTTSSCVNKLYARSESPTSVVDMTSEEAPDTCLPNCRHRA